MPLHHYGVLKARVVDTRAEAGTDTPHFQIHARAGGTDFRIAVNVRSQQSPPDLLYAAVTGFAHPMLPALVALPDRFTAVPSTGGGTALDFVRGNMFDRADLRSMPATAPGPDDDLADALDHWTVRAAADADARVYAFGERWGAEDGVRDKIFGFLPGNGVHDIHMNQGNDGRFVGDDGVWQDGGLLFQFPDAEPNGDLWVAVFLAFQSQSWHTDDTTGHALPADPGPTDPQRSLRVVAALVNPVGPAPEHETVTLLNPGTDSVDLTGWSLVDRQGHRGQLTPTLLPAGEAVRLPVPPPVQLGNGGGTLSLLDAGGLMVDGVAYTQDQAPAGATVVF